MYPLISEERLQEFREIYADEFGEELSDEEALEKALDVLRMFRAIYRPIPRAKLDLYKELQRCYNDDV